MPGPTTTRKVNGRKRNRRTKFFYLAVHESTWYDVHRLADRHRLSLAETVRRVVSAELEALEMQPTTAEGLENLEKTTTEAGSNRM